MYKYLTAKLAKNYFTAKQKVKKLAFCGVSYFFAAVFTLLLPKIRVSLTKFFLVYFFLAKASRCRRTTTKL